MLVLTVEQLIQRGTHNGMHYRFCTSNQGTSIIRSAYEKIGPPPSCQSLQEIDGELRWINLLRSYTTRTKYFDLFDHAVAYVEENC